MAKIKYPNNPITKPQIKKIHTLVSSLRLNDDNYNALLFRFNVDSSTELTRLGASELIETLEDMKNSLKPSYKKSQEHTGLSEFRLVFFTRKKRASNNQLKYIMGLWMLVSRNKDYSSLMMFIKKITGVLFIHIECLDLTQVSNMIVVLEKWKKQKEIN